MNKPIEEIELLGCREAFEKWFATRWPNYIINGDKGWIDELYEAWQARTPSISYGDAVEKVLRDRISKARKTLADIRTNMQIEHDVFHTSHGGYNQTIHDSELVIKEFEQALAAMGIVEGKDGNS